MFGADALPKTRWLSRWKTKVGTNESFAKKFGPKMEVIFIYLKFSIYGGGFFLDNRRPYRGYNPLNPTNARYKSYWRNKRYKSEYQSYHGNWNKRISSNSRYYIRSSSKVSWKKIKPNLSRQAITMCQLLRTVKSHPLKLKLSDNVWAEQQAVNIPSFVKPLRWTAQVVPVCSSDWL